MLVGLMLPQVARQSCTAACAAALQSIADPQPATNASQAAAAAPTQAAQPAESAAAAMQEQPAAATAASPATKPGPQAALTLEMLLPVAAALGVSMPPLAGTTETSQTSAQDQPTAQGAASAAAAGMATSQGAATASPGSRLSCRLAAARLLLGLLGCLSQEALPGSVPTWVAKRIASHLQVHPVCTSGLPGRDLCVLLAAGLAGTSNVPRPPQVPQRWRRQLLAVQGQGTAEQPGSSLSAEWAGGLVSARSRLRCASMFSQSSLCVFLDLHAMLFPFLGGGGGGGVSHSTAELERSLRPHD